MSFDRVLALFDPLLRGAALVVEGEDALGWQSMRQPPDISRVGPTGESKKGHEERLPPLGLSACYVIRQETSAGAQRNGRNAP